MAVVDQGVEIGHRLEHDVAAAPAIAAVGAAEFDEFLAPETGRAGAALAALQVDLALVEKLHGCNPIMATRQTKRGNRGPPFFGSGAGARVRRDYSAASAGAGDGTTEIWMRSPRPG